MTPRHWYLYNARIRRYMIISPQRYIFSSLPPLYFLMPFTLFAFIFSFLTFSSYFHTLKIFAEQWRQAFSPHFPLYMISWAIFSRWYYCFSGGAADYYFRQEDIFWFVDEKELLLPLSYRLRRRRLLSLLTHYPDATTRIFCFDVIFEIFLNIFWFRERCFRPLMP